MIKMKFSVNVAAPQRKPIAVVGVDGAGLFLARTADTCTFVGAQGTQTQAVSLETEAKVEGRTPVYEGDSVTIQF